MKQLKLLFVGLLLVAANGLFAQITFTEGTFEEALAKAKAEKKNLFIDFYANWRKGRGLNESSITFRS